MNGMLTVCIGSFYLVFFMLVLIKNILTFYAINKGGNRYEHLILMMIIFDVVVLLTLPLAMMMTNGVC